jgi:radical SAM superfamily enzyme YgiQ (UPF0313 family)
MLRQRKIRLIEPQSRPGRPFNAWIRRWPLLGPITLATLLDRRGFDVQVYNENLSGPLADNAAAFEDVCSADVVGITIMTPTAMRGYEIADQIRGRTAGPTIVFGGVHATFMPHEARAHGDLVVRGEGETVIEPIARGEIAEGIVQARPVADLDDLPAPNHFLMRDFEVLIGGRRRADYEVPLATSRGCPYGCTYCSVTRMFGRTVRRQSVAKAHADIRRYAAQGFRKLFFYDDNFTTDRAWTRELLGRLRPMRMQFNAQARVDFHWLDRSRRRRDEALLRALRRAGGSVLYVGYETIDEATARLWQKGYRGERPLEDRLAEDTRVLHDSGFWVHAMFVLGPQHTRRTADRVVRFARRNGIESLQISILTPLPGTPLMDQMRPHLILSDFPADWDYFDGTHCVYGHSRLGVEDFQQVVLDAHRRFYRCGGWSTRRVRALLEGPGTMPDKLAKLWENARTARRVMADWRAETAAFLATVRRRMAQAGSLPARLVPRGTAARAPSYPS